MIGCRVIQGGRARISGLRRIWRFGFLVSLGLVGFCMLDGRSRVFPGNIRG